MTLKSDPRSYSQLRSKHVIVTLESRKMYCATTIPRYKPPLPLHEEDVGHCSGASMPHRPMRVGRGILIAFGVFGEDRAGRVQEVNSALACLAASKPPPDLPVRLELWPGATP